MKKSSPLTIINPDNLNSSNHCYDNMPAIMRAKRSRSPEDTDVESIEEENRHPIKKTHRQHQPSFKVGKKTDGRITLPVTDHNDHHFFTQPQENRLGVPGSVTTFPVSRVVDNSASRTSMTSSESPISMQDNLVLSSNLMTDSLNQATGRSQSVPLPSLGKSFNLSELDMALPSIDDWAIKPGKSCGHPNQDYFFRSITQDGSDDQSDSDYEDIICLRKK